MTDELSPADRKLMNSIRSTYAAYRLPTDRKLVRRRLWPWTAALAAVAAGVIVLALVTGPPSALASWTSAPTSSDPEALPDATVDACRQQAATLIRVGEQARWPEDPSLRAMVAAPLVAYDERGTASAALFADGQERAAWICVIIPVAGQPPYVELGGGSALVPEDLGSIEVWTATAGWNSDYGGRWEIAGRVDPEVGRLMVHTEDDREVVATIYDGWFLAWWPSEAEPVRLEIAAAGGNPETIDLEDRYAHEPSCKVSLFGRFCLWH